MSVEFYLWYGLMNVSTIEDVRVCDYLYRGGVVEKGRVFFLSRESMCWGSEEKNLE